VSSHRFAGGRRCWRSPYQLRGRDRRDSRRKRLEGLERRRAYDRRRRRRRRARLLERWRGHRASCAATETWTPSKIATWATRTTLPRMAKASALTGARPPPTAVTARRTPTKRAMTALRKVTSLAREEVAPPPAQTDRSPNPSSVRSRSAPLVSRDALIHHRVKFRPAHFLTIGRRAPLGDEAHWSPPDPAFSKQDVSARCCKLVMTSSADCSARGVGTPIAHSDRAGSRFPTLKHANKPRANVGRTQSTMVSSSCCRSRAGMRLS
jgi:hypothetical protein